MTKYIIGAISDLDTPLTPFSKGARSSGAYMTNRDIKKIQQERDELLNCTQEDIRKLANYIDTVIREGAVCVVGNGQSIEENKEMFQKIEPLFH